MDWIFSTEGIIVVCVMIGFILELLIRNLMWGIIWLVKKIRGPKRVGPPNTRVGHDVRYK